ncbi:hypothetical protein [Mycolicibacterium sphagni]|uniref:NAD(P)H nitroreductase n=1 Tax=Mycolicibacterium sphagni TaxID=1786 RepID=A0A255D631_9MYCO|nr:hypothetical protein [Mycolicibacterium sphagni]OYN74450.1 hypothetical protein CG716_28540 [Mycolicibacterium sphagni]
MPTDFPDDATLCAAIELADRALSIHNSQPWQWRIGPHSLNLHLRHEVRSSYTEPDGRGLIVSCGAALHHASIALCALGWRTGIRRLPNPGQSDHLASLRLHGGPPADVEIAMAAAIPRRQTDRRTYSPWPVAMGDIALMGAHAARHGVTMRRIETTDALLGFGQHRISSPDPADEVLEALDSGVVLALGTAIDDLGSQLRAGEATSAVLLTATVQGLASCAVTEVLEVADTRDALRENVFDAMYFPQMLLRVGWAPIIGNP